MLLGNLHSSRKTRVAEEMGVGRGLGSGGDPGHRVYPWFFMMKLLRPR